MSDLLFLGLFTGQLTILAHLWFVIYLRLKDRRTIIWYLSEARETLAS